MKLELLSLSFRTLSSVLILVAEQARANPPASYQEGLEHVRHKRAQVESYLKQAGVTGFQSSQDDAHSESKAKAPLFEVHAQLTRMRARAGDLLKATLETRLVVGGEISPSVLKFQDDQGLFSELKVLGKARQSSTPGRIQIECDRIITRSGKTILVKGLTLDEQGAQGIAAQVVSGKALAVTGALATSFISGLAASQETQTTNAFGFSQEQPTGRNALLRGVAQSAADQSKRLIEEATSEKPILILEAGTQVQVYLDEEVRF